MSEAFTLRWKLDRPYLEHDKPADVYSLLTIEPSAAALAAAPASLPTHLILLVDVSGSMDVLVRFDPKAKEVGLAFRLPIVAFGTGECKVAFLTELAKTSLAGAFNHIRDENAARQLFGQAVQSQKNIQATNAQLQLWLSPELQVRELYRTRPEILFLGDLTPDPQNLVELRLA